MVVGFPARWADAGLSERPGRLRIVGADGRVSCRWPAFRSYDRGQGGLLDVVLSPDFARDQTIFFSFAQPTRDGARTAVSARASRPGGAAHR